MNKSIRNLACCAALVAVGVGAAEDRAAEERNASYFGINGTKLFHHPELLETRVQERFELMRELGVYWDRIDLWWHVVEPEEGTWDFSWPDQVFDEFERHGVQWYPILAYGAAWWEGRTAPQNEEEVDQHIEYIRRTVERYKDRATYWSLWNEPNIPEFWSPEVDPEIYFDLMSKAYTTIKAIDPDLQVNAFVLAPLGEWDRGFTERLFQLGAADYYDVFDYHYYRNHPPEREVPGEIAEIRAMMARYGEIKPIWISESGVSTLPGSQPESYNLQAQLAVRNQLLTLGLGVERFFYFDLQNWDDDPDGTWGTKLGLVEDGGTPKPAFQAYQTMVNEVDYHDIPGRVLSIGEGVEGVLLREPRTDLYKLALWCPDGEQEITLTTEARDIRVVDLMGENTVHRMIPPREPGKKTREITLTADESPMYVHGVHAPAYLPEAGVRLSQELIIAAPDEELTLKVTAHELMEDARIEVLGTQTPEGIAWDADSGTLSVSATAPPGRHPISAEVAIKYVLHEETHRAELTVAGEVDVVESATVELNPFMRDDQLFVEARISNRSRHAMEEDIRLVQVNADGREMVLGQEAMLGVSANGVAELTFPIRAAQLDRIEEPVQWKLTYGVFESRPLRVAVAQYSSEGPEIDGDLAEWEAIPAIHLGEERQITRRTSEWTPERISADAMFWFTDEAMYLAARVTDNSPMNNPHPPVELWKGDALEWYVGFHGPTSRTVLERNIEYQIGIAPRAKGHEEPVAFLFHHDKLLDTAEIAAVETEDGYIIEARIPFDALLLPEPPSLEAGTLLAIDLAVDDYDEGEIAPAGNVPGRSLMWSGTAMNWIDPSNWGMVILRE